MAISVNTNSTATTASFNLTTANDALRKSLARLSSGKRIVNPADDAAGLAVASKLDSRLSRTQAVRQNNSNALSYLQVQDGALRTIGNIVDRIAELRTMANDITKNSSDIENYSKEFIELQSELKQISRSQFNGISLFTTNEAEHKEGILHRVDDGIEYDGSSYNKYSRVASTHEDGDYDSGHVSINVVNLSYMIPFLQATSYSSSGLIEVRNAIDTPSGSGVEFTIYYSLDGSFHSGEILSGGNGHSVGDVFSVGHSLSNSLGARPPDGTNFEVTSVNSSGGITGYKHVSGDLTNHKEWPGVNPAVSLLYEEGKIHENLRVFSTQAFVDVIERIADARAENGAEQNRLNMVDDLLIGKHTNLEAAHGRIMDADMALESTRFARQNVLVQASASMVAQANQLTSISLTLLG
jgi:flagellin-like hook-associated protein FlgL